MCGKGDLCTLVILSYFPYISGGTVHEERYIGEDKRTCLCCNKTFRCKSHLVRHTIVHTGKKPYQCGVCKKWFNDKSNLKSHMVKHIEINRYWHPRPRWEKVVPLMAKTFHHTLLWNKRDALTIKKAVFYQCGIRVFFSAMSLEYMRQL